MFLLAIGAVVSTSDRYKRQNKLSKLATNLKQGKHRLAKLDGRGVVMSYGHALATPL